MIAETAVKRLTFWSAMLVLFCSAHSAFATDAMVTGPVVVPPAGFIGFCVRYLSECSGAGHGAVPTYDAAHRRDLEVVQADVNRAVAPRAMPAHQWDYPADGSGDCNRY